MPRGSGLSTRASRSTDTVMPIRPRSGLRGRAGHPAGKVTEEKPRENHIGVQIAPRQTARLLRCPERPFEAQLLDEHWSPAHVSGHHVERAADPHDERDRELVAKAVHEP